MSYEQAVIEHLLSLKSLNNFYLADFLTAIQPFFAAKRPFNLEQAAQACQLKGVDRDEFDKQIKTFIPKMKELKQLKQRGRSFQPI